MNARIIASILKRISKEIFTFDMTEDEWRDYHKEHPGAKRWNHHIIPNPKNKPSIKNRMEYAKYLREKVSNKKKYFEKMKEQHPNYEPIIDKKKLIDLLQKGEYTCISAGVNGNDPRDVMKAKNDPTFIKRRTEALRRDLDKLGVKYTEMIGSYEGEEPSFLISHTLDAKTQESDENNILLVSGNVYSNDDHIIEKLNRLGEKYNQDSVGHVKNGNMEFHYTTGPKKGKRAIGKGTREEEKDKKDYFSEARVKDDEYTKWSCNVDWDNLKDNPYFK